MCGVALHFLNPLEDPGYQRYDGKALHLFHSYSHNSRRSKNVDIFYRLKKIKRELNSFALSFNR